MLVAGRAERDPQLGPRARRVRRARRDPAARRAAVGRPPRRAAVAHYDALLRDAAWAAAHAPDLVLRVGDLPTSKPLRQWLHGLGDAVQVAFDPEQRLAGPGRRASPRSSAPTRARRSASLGERLRAAPRPAWLDGWRAADGAAAGRSRRRSGPASSASRSWPPSSAARLPADATLVVASSMPVRDVETFFPARDDAPRVLANRGANGIDGTVSTAFGVAAAARGPTVLLIGDVALAHDIGGLLAATPARA